MARVASIPSELESVPVIDYSKLTSTDPQLRSEAISDLEKACRDWGCFLLINHTVPQKVKDALVDAYLKFFELPLEEKQKYAEKDPWQQIAFASYSNNKASPFSFERDILKMMVRPEFHSPTKPDGFSEAAREYYTKTQEVHDEVLRAISEALGVEPNYFHKAFNLDSGYTTLAANLYPSCPQPEQSTRIPSHVDPNLLTFLSENNVPGLQVEHDSKWFDIDLTSNRIVVNLGHQVELLTNGKYKAPDHRVMMNTNEKTRLSIVLTSGSSPEMVISPGKEFLEREGTRCAPAYKPISLKEHLNLAMRHPNVAELLRI